LEHEWRVLDIARQLGDRRRESESQLMIGMIHTFRQDFQEAMKAHQHALTIQEETADETQIQTLLQLAMIYSMTGDKDRAVSSAEIAISRITSNQWSGLDDAQSMLRAVQAR
jgi:hypothetical protein